MRLWAMVALFSLAPMSAAFAAETTDECQLDETRRGARERVEPAPANSTALSGQVAVAQREAAETASRVEQVRRRNGKRIPDAELIGPRGAL